MIRWQRRGFGFVTLLEQVRRVRGLSMGYQSLIEGVILVIGMALLSNLEPQWFGKLKRRLGTLRTSPAADEA